jgi:potassium-dependent mechanosensitive channel
LAGIRKQPEFAVDDQIWFEPTKVNAATKGAKGAASENEGAAPVSAEPEGHRRTGMTIFCWMALLGTFCLCAAGQTVTMTDVSREREKLARAKGLTDAERNEISGLCEQAAQSLQQEIRWRVQQAGHTRTKAVLENELAAARVAAALPLTAPLPPPPSETSQQVEEELTRVRNERASRIKRRDELSKLQESLTLREDEITTRRAEIRESLQSIGDEKSVLSLASASPQWEQASRMVLQARSQSLEQELLALGTEREALDLRRQLIPLQREDYLLRLEADERLLGELRLRKASARMQDANKSLDSTVTRARVLAEGFPQLSTMAADITSRAMALWGPDGIEAKSDLTAVQSEQMSASLARFKEITASTLRRYQNSGLFSPASEWWPPRVEKFGNPVEVGVLLLGYSANEVVARRDVLRLEDEHNRAPAYETQLQQLVAASGKKPDDADLAEFKSRARSMLQLKRSVATEFLDDGRAYVNRLVEAHRVAAELLLAIRELQSFVFQHVLWARSITGPVLPSASDSARAFLWFFSPRSWSQIMAGFHSAKTLVLFWAAGPLAIFALFLFRGRLRRWFGAFRPNARKPGRIRSLLSSILLALLSALPVPLAIAYVGWVIGQVGEGVDLGRAIASGASSAARFLYLALLVRRMLADGGATDCLMGWSQEVRDSLDGGLRRLVFVFTPLCFVAAALAEGGMYFNGDSLVQSYHNSLGRLCFMVGVLSLLLIGRRTLKADGPVAKAIGEGLDAHGVVRARAARFGFTLACSLPFLLAFLGFYITAYLMVHNLLRTALWTIVLFLASSLLRQWRLDQEERVSASRSPQHEELARKADQQVRRLSSFGLALVWITGLFVIWSAALPALSMLKKVQLRPEFTVVQDRMPAPDKLPAAEEPAQAGNSETPPGKVAVAPVPEPAKTAQTVQPRQPLYLSEVLLAIFVGILTSMLVGNIPGLLQFTVFRRLELDVGGQYAVNTIARYFVIGVGILMVSGILNVNWSSIQWLAAALTFGIGFGLQEIFANFASGLILLLDRSIRVGDVVTVGNLSGIVARIQMRSTTVTLWDRSDMVVPNKEFITAKLVNWTLSNPDTRVDLKVGVDYGSDVELVRQVLLRVAHEHPAVLKSPDPPQVLLTEFSGSAIMFELRVFGMYSYGRPVLLDELYRAVVREFRKVGIVIAFPQLDVHLKAAPPAVSEPNS